jgi:hypothetical protein
MKQVIVAILAIMIIGCANSEEKHVKGIHAGDCVEAFAEWGVNAVESESVHIGNQYNVVVQYQNGFIDGHANGITHGIGEATGSIIIIDRNSNRSVLIHEIGHVLGFKHSPDSTDVMFWASPMPNQRTYPTAEQMLAAMLAYEGKTFKCAELK